MSNEHHEFPHPTQEEIAQCAYLIWEGEGRPAGRSPEHWLQAETQLLACRAHEGWTNGRPNPSRDGSARSGFSTEDQPY